MNGPTSRARYDERLNRITAYIADHLQDDIDLHTIADVAGWSPYHWHRIYHACRGETISATVKRLRLQRAAAYLVNSAMAIPEIAEGTGYRNVAAFTRAFGRVYGMPPERYRQRGRHAPFQVAPVPRAASGDVDEAASDVAITALPPQTAVTIEHRGSYADIGRALEVLYGWLGVRGLRSPGMRSIGIFYDDPAAVPEPDLESRAGVIVTDPLDIEWPLERTGIAGREYAVFTCVGSVAHLQSAYRWLYGEWLPASGREAANEPVFEEYLNAARETDGPATRVCLPLL